MKYLLLIILLFVSASAIRAQTLLKDTTKEKEGVAIAEFGGASSLNLKGGAAYGYSIAVEVTPIEDWLELELGVSPVFASHSHETDIDLLFKKPWTFSNKVEFMLGVGPSYTHANNDGITENSMSGELALDFMFWPGKKHNFGWFLEPAYQYSFAEGHEQSVGLSAGLLISIP